MLDIMRKHASSWLIKLILGAIIITFVFFFGYSSFRKGMRGGRLGAEGEIAAKINGTPVSMSEFEYFFDRNFERLKQSFKDQEIPDFARKLAQSTTFNQLVGREIMLGAADELGIEIPDNELADFIKQSQMAEHGGDFDPIAYRHQFLPSFRSHFGMSYEQLVRQELRLATLDSMFGKVDKEGSNNNPTAEKEFVWTFESAAFNADAKEMALKATQANPKERKKILKSMKVEAQKIGPIGIGERKKLLGGLGTLEDYEKIFALTKEEPDLAAPVEHGDKIYVIRLIEKSEKPAKESFVSPSENFLNEWMSKLMVKAKIQSFIDTH